MRGKKAQLGGILVIVVIMVMLFGVMFYFSSSTAKKKGEKEVERQQLGQLKLEPINEYVQSCFDLTVSNGLELIGRQGGVIYQSQGGIIPEPSQIDLGETHIYYGTDKVKFAIGNLEGVTVGDVFFSDLPEYPWPTFPYEESTGTYPQYLGYYGWNQMSLLNRSYPNSIQEQLESFIKDQSRLCLNFSIFEKQDIEINPGEKNVTVYITAEGLVANIEYPLEIIDISTGTKKNLDFFAVKYPVRLEKFFRTVENLVDMDVRDISFDATNPPLLAGMTVNVLRGVQTEFPGADLIILDDQNSKILDKPYQFIIARPNRPPALFYINQSWLDTKKICSDTLISFSPPSTLVVDTSPCNSGIRSFTSSFNIELMAMDPDEDLMAYEFEGLGGPMPYEITVPEVSSGKISLFVKVTDGEFFDEQEILIPADMNNPPPSP